MVDKKVVLVVTLNGQMEVNGKKVFVIFRGDEGQLVPNFRIEIKGESLNEDDIDDIKKFFEEKLSAVVDEVEKLKIKIKSK